MQIGTTMHQSAERHGQRAKAGWFSRPRALQIAGCTALLCLPVVLTQTTTLSLMLWYTAVAAVSNFRIPLHVPCTSPVASHRSVPTCCYNARISAQTDTNRPTYRPTTPWPSPWQPAYTCGLSCGLWSGELTSHCPGCYCQQGQLGYPVCLQSTIWMADYLWQSAGGHSCGHSSL